MNPFTIAKDIKNIEKILKPALEKYIQGAGFAKSDEIIKIFEPAPEPERVRLLPVIKQMDPGNIAKYDAALL